MSNVRHVIPDCFLQVSDRDWRMLVYSSMATLWRYNGQQWMAAMDDTIRELAIFHTDAKVIPETNMFAPVVAGDSKDADVLVSQTMAMLKDNRKEIDSHFNIALPIDKKDVTIIKLLPTSIITSQSECTLEEIDDSKGSYVVASPTGD